ncbi:MAG: 1-acyl-sn-glycerol-3-phosphate acyltransferase [Clostridiales bacterium]|nr:1-acyl-sn-glycerol-3-phosphate acyltransferase [Clostridiales bacterium]
MADRKRIRYYKTFQDDFVESADQSFALPEDYIWIRDGKGARLVRVVLCAVAYLFAAVYGKLCLHLSIVRNVDWREYRGSGAVVYGNHTQPVGDVFIPVLVCAPKRCYMVASPANLGIPVLGPLLPWMGALPIPGSPSKLPRFLRAVQQRLREKCCVVVYPEGHVWPYCTQIRPYPETSFDYAVKNHVPAFSMTTTYQARRFSDKPRLTVYLDGPFYPDEGLPRQEQKRQLRDEVFACMVARSRNSTYQYVEYRPEAERPADGEQ